MLVIIVIREEMKEEEKKSTSNEVQNDYFVERDSFFRVHTSLDKT